MDLGSHGMRLTQAGTSVPATAMVTANTVAFGNPTVTGFGSLLAQQLHPQSSTNGNSQPVPLTDDLLPPSSTPEITSTGFPRLDAFAHLRKSGKQQQSIPQQTTSVNYEYSVDELLDDIYDSVFWIDSRNCYQ